jgi:hypothetical protein
MASLPEGVNKYLMLVPGRIRFESDAYQQYSDDVIGAINEVYAKMPSMQGTGRVTEHDFMLLTRQS